MARRVLAAPDKFRGTAPASALAAAAVRGAQRAGWEGVAVPLADGGEGLLDVIGGERRRTVVRGPLGQPVSAEWAVVDGAGSWTAVIESARASGIELVGGPERNDPLAATTFGTGQLILEAAKLGAPRIVVGCGGSATTDGGAGALEAIGDRRCLSGIDLVVACDVTTTFVEAAEVFAPQKGATPEQLPELTRRLERLAEEYRREFGRDVRDVPGSGAAGGLAGALMAIGARLEQGFDLVAGLTSLEAHVRGADLVVTGEGRLDRTSLHGKVVANLVSMVKASSPVLVVVGSALGVDASDLAAACGVPASSLEVVSLTERFSERVALAEPVALMEAVVAEALSS